LAQGGGVEVARQPDADPAWRSGVVTGGILPLPQATAERAAVQVVLLAEGLQAQAAPQVLLDEATYFGTTAVLAS